MRGRPGRSPQRPCVRVATTESFSGAPVEAAPDKMQSILDGSLVFWLEYLKARADGEVEHTRHRS